MSRTRPGSLGSREFSMVKKTFCCCQLLSRVLFQQEHTGRPALLSALRHSEEAAFFLIAHREAETTIRH